MKITVFKTGDLEFKVQVSNGTPSIHNVRLSREFADRFDISPEKLVRKSFEFLLAREPKELVLSSFDIPETINTYFPEFESKLLPQPWSWKARGYNSSQITLRKGGDHGWIFDGLLFRLECR